jgi:hypothetical protein
MSKDYLQQIDPRRQQAVAELTGMIKQRYPTASFDVGPAEDDPEVTHITAVVDLDDPDEVTDLVIDRMLELQLEQGIPVYVIPIRTPQRVAALRQQHALERAVPAFPLPPASPR